MGQRQFGSSRSSESGDRRGLYAGVMRCAAALAATLLLIAATWREQAAKLFKEHKYSASAAVLEGRLKDHPRDFEALMLLGLCRQQLDELGKAELSFAEAAQVQPTNSGARYSLARVLFLAGRFEEALAAVADAERLREPPARVNFLRGRIEEERGRFNQALEAYRQALAANRDMVDALAGEASVLYKLGRYVESGSSAKAALRLQPDNAEAKRVAAAVERSPATAVRTSEAVEGATAVRFARKDVIDFRLEHFPSEKKHLISTMTGGLAIFDFDNDGLMDVFFANGAEIPSLKKSWSSILESIVPERAETGASKT